MYMYTHIFKQTCIPISLYNAIALLLLIYDVSSFYILLYHILICLKIHCHFVWHNLPTKRTVLLGNQDVGQAQATLPETNIAPENGWLEDDRLSSFLLGFRPIFRCKMLVSGNVPNTKSWLKQHAARPRLLHRPQRPPVGQWTFEQRDLRDEM